MQVSAGCIAKVQQLACGFFVVWCGWRLLRVAGQHQMTAFISADTLARPATKCRRRLQLSGVICRRRCVNGWPMHRRSHRIRVRCMHMKIHHSKLSFVWISYCHEPRQNFVSSRYLFNCLKHTDNMRRLGDCPPLRPTSNKPFTSIECNPASGNVYGESWKTRHQSFVYTFAKYWPTFKIFHRCTQQEICNKSYYKSHHT